MTEDTPPIPVPFIRTFRRWKRCAWPAALLFSLPLMVALSTGAAAQSVLPGERIPVPLPGVPTGPSEARPSAEAAPARPRLPKDKRTQLEGLFAALKVAPDDRSSKMIADRLDQLFSESGSPSVDLLMARAGAAAEAKAFDLALQILDQVIEIEPDDLGARSKRATILYMRDDYGGALADIREVLAREPRQYAMLYGLALIMRELGDDKRALEAVRKAREVNPRLDGAEEMESQLSLKVEGRGI